MINHNLDNYNACWGPCVVFMPIPLDWYLNLDVHLYRH